MIKPAYFLLRYCCSISVIFLYHFMAYGGMVVTHGSPSMSGRGSSLGAASAGMSLPTIPKIYTICEKDYYLSKCSGYVIGLNTLLGGQFYDPSKTTDPKKRVFNSLLSGVASFTEQDLIDAFQYFFHTCTQADLSANPPTGRQCVSNSITQNIQDNDAPNFLEFLCNPLNAQTECSKCPGNGITEDKSSIKATGSIIDSWHINTIADCYMQEFQDTTGTYVYKENTGDTALCYYNQGNIPDGDILPTRVLYYM